MALNDPETNKKIAAILKADREQFLIDAVKAGFSESQAVFLYERMKKRGPLDWDF